MPDRVTAFYVMIASPSDIPDARRAVYDALVEWNEANSHTRHVAFVPLKWETGAVPTLGRHPQAIINGQLLDRADIVIALFGSRLGMPTPGAISGTVEEIHTAEATGTPVHLYFSQAPHPNDVDPDQLKALRQFRQQLGGLAGQFTTADELKYLVWQAVNFDLESLDPVDEPTQPAAASVRFLAQPGSERLPKTDSRGRLKQETKRWVDLTNQGDIDAEHVKVEPAEGQAIWMHGADETTIHAGQTRRYPFTLSMASPPDLQIRVSWVDGEPHEQTFHIV